MNNLLLLVLGPLCLSSGTVLADNGKNNPQESGLIGGTPYGDRTPEQLQQEIKNQEEKKTQEQTPVQPTPPPPPTKIQAVEPGKSQTTIIPIVVPSNKQPVETKKGTGVREGADIETGPSSSGNKKQTSDELIRGY